MNLPARGPADHTNTRYEPRTVRAVSHAVGLLQAIARSQEPMTLSALARRMTLSKPATYSLLNTLIAEGLVRRADSGTYSIGWGMYEVASVLDRTERIKQAARFTLNRLARSTGGAALLSVLEGDTVLYLDRGQTNTEFVTSANTGRRAPWHTTASGKVLMAGQEDSWIRDRLARPLQARTRASITTTDRLLRELARVRASGFGEARGEQEPLLSSAAVPVRDREGSLRACLAIAVPSRLYDRRSTARLVEELQATAEEILENMQ